MKLTIVGGGTSGLVSALILKKKLPAYDIQIIESPTIPIVGVGEGSTEHWKIFCNECEIDINTLVKETDATHKYGIRFENWTNPVPDYFHSIGYYEIIDDAIPVYDYLNANGKLLTNMLTNPAFIENKIMDTDDIHSNTNQYHFDTFKLNNFLHKLVAERNIKIIKADITDCELDPNTGYIKTLITTFGNYECDFVVDTTGFAGKIMSLLGNDSWFSYSDFLPMNTAIPFPTASDSSGEIRPYTRARAASAGWIWEIPTQSRRGNGYVYSSNYLSDDQAINEIYKMTNIKLDNPRIIKYNSGYLKEQWYKNCVAIGLSSSFLEPLEATSISTSIQQSRLLSTFLSSYQFGDNASIKRYNNIMDQFHDNLVSMIALHYVTDRTDTAFWRSTKDLVKPKLLTNLLELWKERSPRRNDIDHTGYELFQVAHFWHVAQGQNIISPEISAKSLFSSGKLEYAQTKVKEIRQEFIVRKTIHHHEIFKR